MIALDWIPQVADWRGRVKGLGVQSPASWSDCVALANAPLDFVLTNLLDAKMVNLEAALSQDLRTKPIRLAVLGSATVTHLLPAIRVAGCRRDLRIKTMEGEFGQYRIDSLDPGSSLHAFAPTTILFTLDGYHLAAAVDATADEAAADEAAERTIREMRANWQAARETFNCRVIQQTAMPVHLNLFGNNEHRLPGSRHRFLTRLNSLLRQVAETDGTDLLAVDEYVSVHGLDRWHDRALWHRSKQEVAPAAAPFYGDMVARLIAAQQGRSAKCLVLDLDNTLWGGVVGDDGLDGIVLGQGSALGEAFVAFQHYVRELSRRGVILAVCSKNDEANALEPFEKHPDMVLRRSDIACFVANWSDKAGNIRRIAQELSIGLDALVFVDDNPFERNLVRQELPMVKVPEVPEDPAFYAKVIADAGYFEAVALTDEDRERTRQYHGNREREALRESATDLDSYLRGLNMQLHWRRFDKLGLQRIVQLINKSNQFNLTTRRYSTDEAAEVISDPNARGLQLRLLDRFGDNGIICVVILRLVADRDLLIDTWLMSCRVLGRQVEAATLNLIAAEARAIGAERLVGEFIPTAKNGMVKDHYGRLGFRTVFVSDSGATKHVLDLDTFTPIGTSIETMES